MKIVRSRHEQALRDAVQQLLVDGYDIGQIARLVLDAEGVLDLIDPPEALCQCGHRRRRHGVRRTAVCYECPCRSFVEAQ